MLFYSNSSFNVIYRANSVVSFLLQPSRRRSPREIMRHIYVIKAQRAGVHTFGRVTMIISAGGLKALCPVQPVVSAGDQSMTSVPLHSVCIMYTPAERQVRRQRLVSHEAL